jgi:signal transduction histidine kinase
LSSSTPPDLLILDWHMPNLSGLDCCRFVRATRDAGGLPILILTATGADYLAEAFEAGANDFMHKPFARLELHARVGGLIRNKLIHGRLAELERLLRIEGEYRERFIGMLAHDLRQPLNTFALANNTMMQPQSPSLPAGFRSLLEMQNRATKRMNRMIAELLDFTRSRPASGMPISRELVDFSGVARDIVDEMRIGHPDRTLEFNVLGSCEGYWDRDRLAQLCSNLIGNAIEHSSNRSTPIRIDLKRHAENVELSVANAGLAIPESLLAVLFEPFRRGSKPGRSTSGVGLGLHIVNEIVRAHRGTIDVRSDDVHTVFQVTLPIAALEASDSVPPLAR